MVRISLPPECPECGQTMTILEAENDGICDECREQILEAEGLI